MAHLSHPLDSVAVRVASGEAAGFTALYDAMADRLYAAAYRMVVDRGAAEDLVQQAFLELVKTEDRPSQGRSLEAWLFTSIRFGAHDEYRRRSRRPETPTDELPHPVVVDEPDLGLDHELEAALEALTPEQRLVVHLKHVEGLDGHEIADILGSNRSAVYAMAARAEERLRNLLGPVESVENPTSYQENDD